MKGGSVGAEEEVERASEEGGEGWMRQRRVASERGEGRGR